jgi:cytochrome P450
VTLAGIDFTDLDNFADGFPHALFEVHRREAPVYWHPATENTPDGEGFWSVATYAETLAVLRDPETYSSVTGGSRPFGGTLLQDLSIAGQVLNMMDDPVSDVEVYLFFNLLFVPAQKPRETRSPVAYLRWPKIRTSSAFCGPTLALLPTAIEEMVRWTSPSPSKRRTATRTASLGGQSIEPGQKVLVWEGSANRDAAVFENPEVFDVGRKPNPHLGFGQGVHYCLGANLARLELRVLFEELLGRFSSVQVVKPVEWTRSNRHTGIRHLVVELR